MLFVQAIQNLYSKVTRNQIKSSSNRPINNFDFDLSFLLTYVTNEMPFYFYTLTGGIVFEQLCAQFPSKLIQIISVVFLIVHQTPDLFIGENVDSFIYLCHLHFKEFLCRSNEK